MSLSVAFRRAARVEFVEAAAHYEARRPKLGAKFIAEIERCVALTAEQPQVNAVVHANTRRITAHRFPYSIYFRAESHRIVVLAVYQPPLSRWRDQVRPLRAHLPGHPRHATLPGRDRMTRLKSNLAASVATRLLNLGDDYQTLLTGYCFERSLYRPGASGVRNRFVLKGAMLLRLWSNQPYRATRDLDLQRETRVAANDALIYRLQEDLPCRA